MNGPILGGVPRQKYSAATVNITFDGNSLTEGVGGGPYPSYVASMDPLNGLVTCQNVAVHGHTTLQMASHGADATWVAGKSNKYVPWEGTNAVVAYLANGMTPMQAAQQAVTDMTGIIAGRQAVHPWMVILLTCIPRQNSAGQQQTNDLNAALDAYNTILRNTYRTMGARVLVDVRGAGSPFAFADYNMATFETAAASGLWAAGETGGHIHLSNAGYFQIAQMVAAALKRLPAR